MAAPFQAGWRVVDVSVTGPNHVSHHLPNQDAMRHMAIGGRCYALAVADGAGSASLAEHGSQLAVSAAGAAALRVFGTAVPTSLAEWRGAATTYATECLRLFDSALAVKARETDPPAGRADFATTLLTVVASPPWFAYVSVGDGFLVVDRRPGGPHLVVPPPMGREHLGETVFLTSAHREAAVLCEVLYDPCVRGLALCTDGLIEGVLTYSRAADGAMWPVAPPEFGRYFEYFRDPAKHPADLAHILESRDFAATSGDDKTMLLAVLR